ncbi:hypothetical protein M8C21_025544, partial [Ambrosia artemisiifolia]
LKALHEATIDTFFDDAEIRIGDVLKPELENAIKSSRASIIVLSPNYATSTWCLDELALIMDQPKHIVCPVFYHVKPSDVRKQRNSFGDAMAEHKQRMETESDEVKISELGKKIERWKKALTEVADIKGEEANGSRRETIVIEGIVKEISSILELHKRSEIPKLIGMESSVRIISSFLNSASSHTTEFLTIWGMAGIGKTYLADYTFKLHYLEFESSCFLEDIERRCTQPNGLLELQKQLLKDIRVRGWMDIDNVSAATLKIEKSLFRKRTLLVLDGINKFEQLDVLIGTKGLHPGSKIIITSKNGSLTEKCRFFDTLPSEKDKELFKYIACLFVGEDRKFTEDVLKACGICKSSGIKILISRCLLTVGSSDKLMMHQLLQDMGRDMVRQESPKKPWKRSILWRHEECLDVLQNRQGTIIIQGLVLDMRTFEDETSKESSGANMEKTEFRSFPLFSWVHMLELPRSIGKLKNLTQLLIDGCSNLGKFPVEMKDMEALKILTADNLNIKSHMSSSAAAIVQAIPRSSMSFVISLPRSLVRLSLRNNNLTDECFPVDFSGLSMLKELYLDNNPINYMPNCVTSLSRLETLSFDGCHNLKTILCAPDILKYLRIYNCYSLEKITFHPEKSAPPEVIYFDASSMTEIQDKFKMQAVSEIDEEVLRSLGWMLYEHGIFSTYLQGQEIPKWFTHRSSGSVFTLQSSSESGKIQGLNVCTVSTVSSMTEVGPSRIEIRNLTKNSSWTYQPRMYVLPEDDAFEDGDEVVIVWLSHWMFGENEFEDGDEYANVREYVINLVYDDDGGGGGGGNRKEDPLDYDKSWKHIISGNISAAHLLQAILSQPLPATWRHCYSITAATGDIAAVGN